MFWWPRTSLATSPYLASNDLAAFYEQAMDVLNTQKSDNIGIACYPESGTAREALSLRADQAMYKAKAAGMRRYAIAS